MATTLRRISALAAVLVLAAGCADNDTTAPLTQAAPTSSASQLLGLNLTLVSGVQRTTPLASDITVSQVIGSGGGTLSIPAAGVTVTVPAGAVSAPVTFTMTARKGSLLAYDFAPHGITFARPLAFSQKLQGTNASLLNANLLNLGYYPDASLLGATSALVSELIGGNVSLLSWTFTSSIRHFSGYVVACGRGEE